MIEIFNIHFGNMGDMFETYDVVFEIYIEDKLTNRQQMQAPKEMLIANFLQTAKQIQVDRRPIKIKMIRQEEIWDKFEQRRRTLNYEIALSNNAMVAWEESKR